MRPKQSNPGDTKSFTLPGNNFQIAPHRRDDSLYRHVLRDLQLNSILRIHNVVSHGISQHAFEDQYEAHCEGQVLVIRVIGIQD